MDALMQRSGNRSIGCATIPDELFLVNHIVRFIDCPISLPTGGLSTCMIAGCRAEVWRIVLY